MFYKVMFCIILFIVAKFSGIVVVKFLTQMSKVIERKIKKWIKFIIKKSIKKDSFLDMLLLERITWY